MEISGSSSSKKRKTCPEEDEEDEAKKMETFFALVRSIRETRDRWMDMGLRSDHDSKKKRMSKSIITGKEENIVKVWRPTFEAEDFAEELARGNKDSNLGKEEDAEKGINLRLSL